MPDGELGRYCEALRDEKRALVDRLLQVREEIKKLAEELSKIEDKFKVPIGIYRSSAVVGYQVYKAPASKGRGGHHKRYVEFRVWIHTKEPLLAQEDMTLEKLHDLLNDWLDHLIEKTYDGPPIRANLEEYISYEEDELIDEDEVRPNGAKISKFYGFTWYSGGARRIGGEESEEYERQGNPFWYLCEQVNEHFEIIAKGYERHMVDEVNKAWFKFAGRLWALDTALVAPPDRVPWRR